VIAGQPANTVELRFTVMGDANLDRIVDMNDATRLQANYNTTGSPAWDGGNFNFDTTVDSADALLMTRNYGVIANGSAQPATASTSTVLAATHAASSVKPTSSSGPPITENDASTRKNQRTRKHR
jgi:hypothetical protein